MEFRERGNTVQLFRLESDASGKAAKKVLVGSLQKPGLEISSELKAKLSAQDLDKTRHYQAKVRGAEASEREYFASRYGEITNVVADWLETIDEATAHEFVEETRKVLAKLRRRISALER